MPVAQPPASARWYRWVFVVIALALLALLLKAAPDFGATWDEPQQRAKALRLLSYLAGHTATLNEPIDGAHLYGAPFDLVSGALEPLVPADPYVIRHEVIAVVGWLGIVLCGLLADRMFGPPHGVFSMVLLTAAPLYFAHAMNNPKDLPFATIATAVLLALTRIRAAHPVLPWRQVVAFAALIGLGLNVRPGALLFIAYLGVVVLYRLQQLGALEFRSLADAGLRILAVLAGAVAVGWVAWPWAYAHPIVAPFRAMAELGHFGWGGAVLFDGVSYRGTALPWDYVPRWFWLTTPPVLLGGAALSVFLFTLRSTRDQAVALWSAVVFPVLYVAGTRATLYDGIRHLLFVLPPLTILAAAGWSAAWRAARPAWRPAFVALIAIGLLEPVVFQWRNHPNQTAYVQPLAGGPRAAFARYDLDYWGNCVLQAFGSVNQRSTGDQIYVSGWPMLVLQADASRFPKLTLVDPSDHRTQYFITLARGSSGDLLALDRRRDVIDRVTTADGALLCAVSTSAATPRAPISPR